ncbi:MAG: AAA family ATPase [Pikeienuella sp.]
MRTRGFLLGKFLPPHAGHVFLCRTAAALCDELTVLVCTLERDPIDGRLRHEWMKALLPQANIVHFTEDAPQEPSEHPDFWNIWRKICRDAHPRPIDLVFGSEPYVARLARELGAAPMMIDPERLAFPVSGTAVRADPARVWDMIPGPVRPHYQKRVVLAGAESTGKSTLASRLAARLGTRFVPEFGRVFDASRDADWTGGSFATIEAGHAATRAAIAPMAGPLLIEDTDELVTRAWERLLTGAAPARPRPAALADLHLLLDTDLVWRDDGTRYQGDPAFRERFQSLMRRELEESGARWRLIGGQGDERLANALAAINDAFGAAVSQTSRAT